MKKIVNTKKAPAAIGPYSQAVQVGSTLYISGQLPIDPETGAFPQGGIKEQTRQSLQNISEILKENGMTLANVVKTTIFVKDMATYAEMNEVYAEFFTSECPARAAFEVAKLPKDALVEIEAIAAN